MSTAARIGREYAAQIVALLVAMADRLFIPAVLIRYLGIAEFSAWSIALATGAFIGVLEFGLTRYYTNRLLYLVERGEISEAQQVYRIATTLLLVLVVVAVAAISLAFPYFVDGVGDPVVDEILPAVVIPVTMAAAILQMLALRQALYRAHRHFTTETFIRLAGEAARIAAVTVSAWTGASLLLSAWLWFGATIAFIVIPIGLDTLRRYGGYVESPRKPPPGEFGTIARVAPGLWLQSMFTTLYASLPVLAIGAITGFPAIITQFVLMRTIANFVRQIQQMFANLFAIELARRAAIGDDAGHAQVFREASRLLGVQSAVSSALLIVLGDWLFGLWTGRTELFDLRLLLLAIAPPLIVPASMLSIEALSYANRPWPAVRARIAQAVLTIVLFFALPIEEVALRMMAALALGEIAGLGLPLMFAVSTLNSQISKRTIVGLSVVVAATTGASCAAIYFIDTASLVPAQLRHPVALGAGILIVVFASLFVGLSRARRAQLLAFARSAFSGTSTSSP